MFKLHLSPNRQTTLPKELCDWLGVKPGEDLMIEVGEHGRVTLLPHESGAGMLAQFAVLDEGETPQPANMKLANT